MLEVLTYPVSAVIKLWHLLLHNVLGMDASMAWIFAIVGLVVTVRTLLLPFFWAQKRSSRQTILMRPEKQALEEEYADTTDPRALYEKRQKTREMHKRYGFNPLVGCVPPLVQIPIIIGLYRLLMWMSRPEMLAGHERADGGLGVLSEADLVSFMQTELFGVPVPAYVAMTEERLAILGTTASEVTPVVAPFVIVAALLAFTNLCAGTYNTWKHMDWSMRLNRGMFKFMIVMTGLLPLFILWLGLAGPLPFALVFYWVVSNLWMVVQTLVLNTLVQRRWPETEEHHELRRRQRAEHLQSRRDKKAAKKEDRDYIRSAKERGSTRAKAKAELKKRDQDKAAEKKARRKKRRQAEALASRQLSRERAQKMKKRRAAEGEAPQDQME